jgi:hypothetical protein
METKEPREVGKGETRLEENEARQYGTPGDGEMDVIRMGDGEICTG